MEASTSTETNPLSVDKDLAGLLSSGALSGFDLSCIERIYTWSPVFRVQRADHTGGPLVLKTTKTSTEGSAALGKWLAALRDAGVSVVSPQTWPLETSPLDVVEGSRHWVLYQFCMEDPEYMPNSTESLAAAGHMLGAIHAFGGQHLCAPAHWAEWEELDDGVTESLEAIQARFSLPAEEFACFEQRTMAAKAAVHHLREAHGSLPSVDASWDFKRTNLVFTTGGPTLVDPDNGAHIPRILDLAMALLTWPFEGNSWTLATKHLGQKRAAPRPLSPEEWRHFVDAYSKSVELTEDERSAWPNMLHYVFCQEVLWQMGDDDNHHHSRDIALVRSLVTWDYTHYACV